MALATFLGACRRFATFLPILYILLSLLAGMGTSTVMLIGNNVTLSFDDIEANFTPEIKGSGECGILYLAEPLNACSPLANRVVPGEGVTSPFALIIRGGCAFEDKVRRAQDAGFKAAIVFNDKDGPLVAMAGDSAGIKIHAVFVSKASGETLKEYAGLTEMDLWIIPTFENSAWSIMAISFISLLAISAVLATCFFVRRHRIRRERARAPNLREFHGMSSRQVKAMPSLIFTSVLEDNCTSRTCAICLEDYNVGEKLRVLPCRHKFHAFCVDSWLTSWRTFCPVCKRDARTSTGNLPASECTPLLSSSHASLSSSAALSSVRSSVATSSAIQIAPGSFCSSAALSSVHSSLTTSSAIQIASTSFQYPSTSRTHSISSTPYQPQSLRSYNSPALSLSRSSVDLRNASSHRSHASHLVSPHSVFPLYSPLNSRYASSPYVPSSSNGSPSYVGSSSRQQFLRHCSESAASISPFASAQSLPGC
ncbi:receptor homology region, transmembrane domain- and RING domain-containing protein 2-like [Magnolia sinica]|uniref:receptor homology region, transmembrane domain- and RING domain-containing protein 2-like n=1 Tax=Magnolia sinica TaxID=86752 RepID=UPI00265A42B2|nr:receptor homology region, transmembrane domain- and RING domain-containing protein 2-like [Magnolia sinica]XP_058088491.1 receptor homology region, transmembrane domain- and RING domain-containing protein 2-like [Magnolia sinica]